MPKYQVDGIVPCVLVSNDEYWLPYTLKCIKGMFSKYVLYDVGSEDRTPVAIDRFVEEEKKRADIVYRRLPMCPKGVQGTFRNSMIAETNSDWYFIVDGDEVYSKRSIQDIADHYITMQREYEFNGKIYGKFRRIEICDDLCTAYGTEYVLFHHRLYHRTATWTGPHPGERAVIDQNSETDYILNDVICYHFHNALRSSQEDVALLRKERKNQKTYQRGNRKKFPVLDLLPDLTAPVWNDYPVHPKLKEVHVHGKTILEV